MNKTSFARIAHTIIGTALYSGYAPVAPGTAGSLLAVIFLWYVAPQSTHMFILMTAAITIIGAISASYLEKEWGKDPQRVTIDEAAGIAVSLIALPKIWWVWAMAFVLFRAFDIFKPPPVRQAENLPGGIGIMADDLVAGVYANVCCWIILWLI